MIESAKGIDISHLIKIECSYKQSEHNGNFIWKTDCGMVLQVFDEKRPEYNDAQKTNTPVCYLCGKTVKYIYTIRVDLKPVYIYELFQDNGELIKHDDETDIEYLNRVRSFHGVGKISTVLDNAWCGPLMSGFIIVVIILTIIIMIVLAIN